MQHSHNLKKKNVPFPLTICVLPDVKRQKNNDSILNYYAIHGFTKVKKRHLIMYHQLDPLNSNKLFRYFVHLLYCQDGGFVEEMEEGREKLL